MTAIASPGWQSRYLTGVPAGVAPAAEFAVRQTLGRYAFALDQHDLVALADVLTEDAVWAFSVAGETEIGPITGRAAILDLVRASAEGQTDQRRHHLTNPVFLEAGPGTAVVQAYLTLTSNAGPRIVATGFYRITLREDGGEWRIADLFAGLDNAE